MACQLTLCCVVRRHTGPKGGRFSRGFTVIEVMLMVLIIALFSTLAAFGMIRGLGQTRLRGQILAIQRLARYGRFVAIHYHRTCRLYFDLNERIYWLEVVKQPQPVGRQNDKQPTEPEPGLDNHYLKTRHLPEQLEVKLIRSADKQISNQGTITISFNIDGSADPALIQVGWQQTEKVFTLVVYPWTGRTELFGRLVDELPLERVDLDKVNWGDSDFR